MASAFRPSGMLGLYVVWGVGVRGGYYLWARGVGGVGGAGVGGGWVEPFCFVYVQNVQSVSSHF